MHKKVQVKTSKNKDKVFVFHMSFLWREAISLGLNSPSAFL